MSTFQARLPTRITAWQEGVTALLLMAAATATRELILPTNTGFAFLTFFPAMTLAYLLGGVRCGLLVSLLSALMAQRYVDGIHPSVVAATTLIFLGVSLLMAVMRHREQRSLERLAHNMTTLQQRDRAITRQAQELEDLYQHAPSAHCTLTDTGHFVRINQVIIDWFGGNRDTIVAGPGLADYLTEDSQPVFLHALSGLLCGGSMDTVDLEIAPPGRPRRWISLAMMSVADPHGLVLSLRCTMSDVSAHKAREIQLRFLNQNELSILDCGLFLAAKVRDGKFSWVSAGLVSTLGYPPAELLGQPVDLLRPAGRTDIGYQTALQLAMQSGERQQIEIEVACRDRSRRILDLTGLLLDGPAGEVLWLASDITARKTLERIQTQQAEQLRDLYDQAPCGHFVLDSAGFFIEINQTYLDWLGLTRVAVIRHCKPTDFMTADDRPLFAAHQGGLRSDLTEVCFDYRLNAPDGGLRWIALRAYPMRDEEGAVVTTRCVAFDISERKSLECALQRANREQDAILNCDLFGVGRSANRLMIWSNRGLQRMLGYSAEELDGLPSSALFQTPADHAAHGALCYPVLRSGQDYRCELALRRKDGHPIWVDVTARLVSMASDETLSFWSDITPRKQLEADLRAAAERIEDLYEHAPCGYHSVDQQGNFLHVNATERSMLGITMETLGNPNLKLADFCIPEDRHKLIETFMQVRATREIASVEVTIISAHGIQRDVCITMSAVFDTAGSFTHSRSVMVDITARRAAERALATIQSQQAAILNSDLLGLARISNRTLNWVSPGLARMMGYSVDALEGQPTRLLHASTETYTALGEAAYARIAAGETFRAESPLLRRNGEIAWVELTGEAFPLTDETLWIFTDITHQHQIKRALRESEAMLERTNVVAGIGGWQIDLPSQKVHWSRHTHRMLEAPAGFVPDLASALALYPPESLRRLEPALARAAEDSLPFDLELELTTLTGRPIWARVVGAAEVVDGEVVRLVGAFQDVTAHRMVANACRTPPDLPPVRRAVGRHDLQGIAGD